MTDRRPLFDQDETPEDVATLYSWANLHGAKYRDFSASRAQSREKARLRVLQAIEEEKARAQHLDDAVRPPEVQNLDDIDRAAEMRRMAESARANEEAHLAELAEQQAARDAAQRAEREAAEAARRESEAWAARQASELAAREAAERAEQQAADRAMREAEELAARLAAERAAREAAEQAEREVAEQAEREAAENARRQAEELAARHVADQEKREAEEQAAREAAKLAEREAAEQAKRQAEELAAQLAAEDAAREAARIEAEEKAQQAARQLAAQRAAQEAELQATRQAAEKAAQQLAAQRAALQAQAARDAADRAAEEAARMAEKQAARQAAEQAAQKRAAEEAARQAAQHAAQPAARPQSILDHLPAIPTAEPRHADLPPAAQKYPLPHDLPGHAQPMHASMPGETRPHVQNPWVAPDQQDSTGRPAWLTPERHESQTQKPASQAPEDTLQGSRERLASRWYALRSVFDGAGSPAEVAPAPVAARAPVVAVFSLAGGVGKTSLVATLGRALSARGERVLLVDTAPYGLLPFFFGARDQRPGLLRTFSPPGNSGDAPIQMVTIDPEGIGPDTANQEPLSGEIGTYSRGSSRVIVDLATASGATTRRILRMSPLVLVPLIPDMNSVVSFSSIDSFFQHNGNASAKSLPHYVLNQFDPSLPLHLDIREVLREQLGDRLLPFVLRRAPAVSEALAEGMTVMDYAPNSTVAEDFGNLASWVKSQSAPASSTYRGVRWSER